MDTHTWLEKRGSLRILKNHSNQSSKLKKKQSIINKLKCLHTENFISLLEELENENFNKFHTEIVNNLLSNPIIASPPSKSTPAVLQSTFDYIHKIVEVVYLFSFDSSLMGYLVSSLKKGHSNNWTFCCILLEIFILNTKQKKMPNTTLETVAQTLLKTLKGQRLSFILYSLKFFDIDKSVFVPNIEDEIKTINEDNFEILKEIAGILKINEDLKIPNSYIEIVKPVPGEFSFYEDSKVPSEFVFPPFSMSMIKNIEKKKLEPYMLDYIGQNICSHPELITKIINKKKYVEFIPSLARILSKAIKNSKSYCGSILSCQNTDKDLILIAECYKFGLFTSQEIFNLINQLIDKHLISKLCVILEQLGRYILYKKETNRLSIEMIEKVKNSPLDNVSKIQFSQCISMILNPEFCKINILDFLRWFFNSTDYETNALFAKMKKSPRFLLLVLSQPSIFENEENFKKFFNEVKDIVFTLDTSIPLAKTMKNMIEEENTSSFLIGFYLFSIPRIYEKHKTLALDYAQAISFLARKQSQQTQVINTLLKEKVGERLKYRIILLLLDSFDPEIHEKYIEILNKRQKGDAEFRAMLFNFCEKHHYACEVDESDSFEREMCLMEESD
ncbi:uncharacterized protein VICG_01371 [Vittaforma corneae ATCC 50505]|uniref:Uncharacterized protein n=1 Tax=Vittaforma corneae (strain ATCC 50505) TaxID=993615 RepID=L2GL80_VITCO|nr:uncharacterized protein VICG_01371 [Vittaforma corneae ATCC 50505]ELA41623.1 hypothetical protein VICG_01371 [Vittaforma corneae ATCC 50505]